MTVHTSTTHDCEAALCKETDLPAVCSLLIGLSDEECKVTCSTHRKATCLLELQGLNFPNVAKGDFG